MAIPGKGSTGGTAAAGAGAAGAAGAALPQRERRFSPLVDASSLPQRDLRLRGTAAVVVAAVLVVVVVVVVVDGLSFCLRYSLRASFHPGQLSTSFQRLGYGPYLSCKVWLAELLYHVFMAT